MSRIITSTSCTSRPMCAVQRGGHSSNRTRKNKNKTKMHTIKYQNSNSLKRWSAKTSTRMYYRSGTGVRCCIGAKQMLLVYSQGGVTFLREMTSWPPSWKCHVKSKIIWLRQSISIYVKKWAFLPNFTMDPIWNNGYYCFLWRMKRSP